MDQYFHEYKNKNLQQHNKDKRLLQKYCFTSGYYYWSNILIGSYRLGCNFNCMGSDILKCEIGKNNKNIT